MSTLVRNVLPSTDDCSLPSPPPLVVIILAIIFMLFYDIECHTWLMKNGPLSSIARMRMSGRRKVHQANFLIYSFPFGKCPYGFGPTRLG